MEADKTAVLFENETVYSEKLFRSVYGNHFFTRPMILVACFLALQPLGSVIASVFESGASALRGLLPLVGLGLIVLLTFFRSVRQLVSRELEAGGGSFPRRTIQVYDDRIHMRTSAGEEYDTPLTAMKAVRVTKSYIQVTTEEKRIYVLSRGDFTVGTFEECAYFLQTKLPRRSFFGNMNM